MPPWIKQWIYSLKFYNALAWEIRWFPSPFAPENVASKIHMPFASLPNGSLGYLIHWSLTKTIALVLCHSWTWVVFEEFQKCAQAQVTQTRLKYIRSIWNLMFPKNTKKHHFILSLWGCERPFHRWEQGMSIENNLYRIFKFLRSGFSIWNGYFIIIFEFVTISPRIELKVTTDSLSI